MEAERYLDNLIAEGFLKKCSDIHFHPTNNDIEVFFRVDGLLKRDHTLKREDALKVYSRIKVLSNLDITRNRHPQQGSFKLEGKQSVDVRVSTINTVWGEKLVLRLFPYSPEFSTFEALGMEAFQISEINKLLNIRGGLILVCGPTGSGKTTTLYTMANQLYDESVNIVTIEDPVEYKVPHFTQIDVAEELGLDFSPLLTSVLRQDPDIIIIGEVRNAKTAQIAIRAALTGHTVLASVHTEDTLSSIDRFINLDVNPAIFAEAFRGALAQRLIRIKSRDDEYRGRTGIFEVLLKDENLKSYILKRDQKAVSKVREKLFCLKQAAHSKKCQNITDKKEINRVLGVFKNEGKASN
ncbi:ATPase, T2SS/T4P/T4SS family [Proteinivorax hydrogeniformans]|uniref:ATPase, T2SS/T4P/T4SS family n=1 Tax=Proteinivorax hydrogeniformans TaxID=1826727 RepID=A0AAU8HQZ3_9FIRM